MPQYSGKLISAADLSVAETAVLAIPGVTKFVQVFPNKDASHPMFLWIVVHADDDVLPMLKQLVYFQSIELAPPRYTCSP